MLNSLMSFLLSQNVNNPFGNLSEMVNFIGMCVDFLEKISDNQNQNSYSKAEDVIHGYYSEAVLVRQQPEIKNNGYYSEAVSHSYIFFIFTALSAHVS